VFFFLVGIASGNKAVFRKAASGLVFCQLFFEKRLKSEATPSQSLSVGFGGCSENVVI